MKILWASSLVSLLMWPCFSAAAESLSSEAGFFASGKEVFRPLMADPREVSLALRVVTPVGHRALGEVSAGDYFGLYRWVLPWKDAYLQWSVAGGFFARFDLVAVEKDLQVLDFTASMPFDLRVGKWCIRLLPYHQSSHLGDDYLERTGESLTKYSMDSFKTLAAWEPSAAWRLYTGYNFTIRHNEDISGGQMLQAGFEWSSAWWSHEHAQLYWANDFQSWERIGWNPILNTQGGVRFARSPQARQRLAVFLEYGTGHQSFGQFYEKEESHWVLGLRFEFL